MNWLDSRELETELNGLLEGVLGMGLIEPLDLEAFLGGIEETVAGEIAFATAVSFSQSELDKAQSGFLEMINGFTQKTVVDVRIPDLPKMSQKEKLELFRELIETLSQTIILNRNLYVHIFASSEAEAKVLRELLSLRMNRNTARFAINQRIQIMAHTHRLLASLEGLAAISVAPNPMEVLSEKQAELALNASFYAGENNASRKSIELGPGKVTLAQLYLAALETLSQKTVEGLTRHDRIIEARGPEVFSAFQILLQGKILSNLARQAMARAA